MNRLPPAPSSADAPSPAVGPVPGGPVTTAGVRRAAGPVGPGAPFDVVFLSLDEPLADELFDRLTRVVGPAKRLHGVQPMRRAYRLCGHLADTEQFLLADGDFDIHPDFPAAQVPPLADDVAMRVWPARNPVNGLTYGYGGLKLIRADALCALADDNAQAVDVLAALPGRVEFATQTAGVTRIDQSRYHAWKAGFRECAMLARGCEYGATGDQQRERRITAWTSGGQGLHALWAARGAADGLAFAAATPPGARHLWDQINDPRWLRARFLARRADSKP